MHRIFAIFLPMLIKKRSWGLLAALGAGWFMFGGQGFSLPSVSLPDMSIDQLWKEPVDILTDRVEDARDAQEETIEEFQSAMEKFKLITNFKGGKLEDQYNTLNKAYERSKDSADDISSKVDKVARAANTLLTEWKDELGNYHDAGLRRKAERQFDETRVRTERLLASMRGVEKRTVPVLAIFKDQVLYLKHNLNARAINSLNQERVKIETDVGNLIREMQAAITEANAFIKTLSVKT